MEIDCGICGEPLNEDDKNIVWDDLLHHKVCMKISYREDHPDMADDVYDIFDEYVDIADEIINHGDCISFVRHTEEN